MSVGARQRLRVRIEGTVQGVGFRPFVYRIARSSAWAAGCSTTRAAC